jgi:outer membrane protein OmpA-like peptidoglycan-associated protein
LARVGDLFRVNNTLKVEIGGHTDSIGTAEANVALSNKRAQNVRAFLVKTGVPALRLSAVGYGEAQPAKPNITEEGRALNRRIEFTILGL